jgi:membrane-associated phospholipid phosphatase
MRQLLKQRRRSLLALAVYFVVYMAAFALLEKFVQPRYYIHCALDDLLPFCKWAIIPYVFWFIWIPFVILYLLWKDEGQFTRLYYAMVIGSFTALAIYAIFPNGLQLRRMIYEQDFLSRMVVQLREIDTSTNVCPSLHVYQSLCVCLAIFRSASMRKWRGFAVVATVAISVSTVLLDQHSVIDVLCAVALCLCVDGVVTMILRRRERSVKGVYVRADL